MKLLYKDITRIILGFLFFIGVTCFTIYGYKKSNDIDSHSELGPHGMKIIHLLVYTILTGISFAIMFG